MTTATYIGVDIETTGLEHDALVLELAMVALDEKFNEIAHFNTPIYHAPNTLDRYLSQWARYQHTSSGLLDEVHATDWNLSTLGVEVEAIRWISELSNGNVYEMLGSSVKFDLTHIQRAMPELAQYFHHYRVIDTTSFRLVGKKSLGLDYGDDRASTHRALDDIRYSVDCIRTTLFS